MTSNISSEKMEFKTIAYAARIKEEGTNQEITQVNYWVKGVLRILLPVKGGLRNVLFQAI